jgi:hypothetical protein
MDEANSGSMRAKCSRFLRRYYLQWTRLEGDPGNLALGIALGVFAGVMPVIPFQTILALTLALVFRASKVAAALGTWVSNPLTWTFLYYSSYKLGAWFLGLSGTDAIFVAIMTSIRAGEEWMVIVGKMAAARKTILVTFLTGGFLLGLISAVPSYLFSLAFFLKVRQWREETRSRS